MEYVSEIEETALHTKDSAQSENESVAARLRAAYAMALNRSLVAEQEVVPSPDFPARASNLLLCKLWSRLVGRLVPEKVAHMPIHYSSRPAMRMGLLRQQIQPSSLAGGRRLALGFTLIEVMVVITILAIMLSLAVPSMRSLLEGNRLEARSTELAASIHLARMEAIKRGPGARVSVTPNTKNDWTAGWTVFVDTTTDANDGASPTAGALNGNTIVQVTEALPGSVTVSAGALGYVSFVGSGDAKVTTTDAAAPGFVRANGGYLQGVVRLVSGTQSRCIRLVPPGLTDVLVNPAACN